MRSLTSKYCSVMTTSHMMPACVLWILKPVTTDVVSVIQFLSPWVVSESWCLHICIRIFIFIRILIDICICICRVTNLSSPVLSYNFYLRVWSLSFPVCVFVFSFVFLFAFVLAFVFEFEERHTGHHWSDVVSVIEFLSPCVVSGCGIFNSVFVFAVVIVDPKPATPI